MISCQLLFCSVYVDLQVTQSKTSLEQALKLTKKLKKESASLREFVTSINKELSKREVPTAAKDIEDELVWAKVGNSLLYKDRSVSSRTVCPSSY